MKKHAAVICASGIGDGLLMMIAAHHLQKCNYEVTLFHDTATSLSLLFDKVKILPHPLLEDLEPTLKKYDKIFVENDHSAQAWYLFKKRENLPQLFFFFPTPSSQMQKCDYLFNPNLPVASNLAQGCAKLLGTSPLKENGLTLPEGKTFRKYPRRVVIHPTSNDPKRNWKKTQFLKLATLLEKKNYTVTFCVEDHERERWGSPYFKNLKDVSSYIYESGFFIGNDSGLGHLASNLGIPTLTISGNPKRTALWRPDWSLNSVITLPFPLPNFKGIHFRFREDFWQYFISPNSTLKAFEKLIYEYESSSYLF